MAKFTKREILALLPETAESVSPIQYIMQKLNKDISILPDEDLVRLKRAIATVKCRRDAKFESSNRLKDRFEKNHSNWLDSEFVIPQLNFNDDIQMQIDQSPSGAGFGRPALAFTDKSERSKRREVAMISSQHANDPERLLMACRHASRLSGDKDLNAVLKELSKSPTMPSRMRQLVNEPRPSIIKMTPEEALDYLLRHNLSKENYISMRIEVKSRNADIFPAYQHLKNAKEKCRPPKEEITLTETSAETSLQALLDHTATRTAQLQKDVIVQALTNSDNTEMEAIFIFSWGLDGSTGHSPYQQQYEDRSTEVSDESLVATTLIPLRLTTANNIVLWNNKASQSPISCRPIKIKYVKESADEILKQKKDIEDQIEKLKATEISLDGLTIRIHFSLFMTLIDGKVLNIITGTKSMQTCPICHATPSMFNDLSNKENGIFSANPNSLQYGISPLHAWIRFLECCLHISYRVPLKKWQMRSKEDKAEFAKQKSRIQALLWDRMGLRVDKPKAGGSGSTNDGNTARRAFRTPKDLAQCLGLNEDLLHNFRSILIALSCHLPIDVNLFGNLCASTAELYVKHYPWYPMPSSVHKVLMHGAEIIKYSIVPVGMLGEEASEARNKHYKAYRRNHARKHSRSATLADIFYRVMDSSDPIIASLNLDARLQKSNKRKQLPFPAEVRNLFSMSQVNEVRDSENESEIEEDDDQEEENFTGLSETLEFLDDVQLTDNEDGE